MTSIMTTSDCAVVQSKRGGSSAYDIQGALSGITSYNSDTAAIIINDVVISDKDVHLPVVATDDVRVLFKFGQDFGSLIISGRIYLGSPSCSDGDALRVVEQQFKSARLSATNSPSSVSIAGGNAYPVYPIELKFSDAQAQTNSVGFAISCIIAPSSSASK